MIVIAAWAVIYVALAAFGHVLVGPFMGFIRWHSDLPPLPPSASVFWIGTTERLVTMVLFARDPNHLAWFIGAWVALKFALNYRRREMKTESDFTEAMLALVGNVLSFGFALFAAWICSKVTLV